MVAALLLGGAAPTVAVAQTGGSTSPGSASVTSVQSIDVRLSLAENRIMVLERDRDRLAEVPQQLTRIETRLDALTERTNGWGANVTSVVIGVFMMLGSAVVGAAVQSRRGGSAKAT